MSLHIIAAAYFKNKLQNEKQNFCQTIQYQKTMPVSYIEIPVLNFQALSDSATKNIQTVHIIEMYSRAM